MARWIMCAGMYVAVYVYGAGGRCLARVVYGAGGRCLARVVYVVWIMCGVCMAWGVGAGWRHVSVRRVRCSAGSGRSQEGTRVFFRKEEVSSEEEQEDVEVSSVPGYMLFQDSKVVGRIWL